MLLVDDDPVILRCHIRCLDDEFDVETCSNASDAERRVAEGGIDVVVSDVSMPGMTGFQLMASLRRTDAYLPVILASAVQMLDCADDALDEGAFVYLTKPVAPAMLRAAVRLAAQYRRTARTEPPPAPSPRFTSAPPLEVGSVPPLPPDEQAAPTSKPQIEHHRAAISKVS